MDGKKYKPFDGGQAAYRFLVPKEELTKDPRTLEFVKEDGKLGMVMGFDRRLVFYPCVNNTLMNFLVIHPSSETRAEGAGEFFYLDQVATCLTSRSDWNLPGDKSKMLELTKSFGPDIQAMLEKAPKDTLKVWTLLDMETMKDWTNGNMALLGDAAHPFLPHQGQGGAQAIEDAVSLAAVLPLGTPKVDIPERLRLYQQCRQGRANKIQDFTRTSGLSKDELKKKGLELDRELCAIRSTFSTNRATSESILSLQFQP